VKPLAYRTRRVDGTDEEVADTLRDLHTLCFGTRAPQVKPQDEGYWWITRLGDEPVAFCGMLASKQWAATGYLHRVGVLPAHRGKGLQQRLIAVREAHARKLGWTHTITDTTENTPSSNSLIRRGYVLYEPAKPWGFTHTLYWKKRL
jgi:GNAT superfamily N-acetyltransferase